MQHLSEKGIEWLQSFGHVDADAHFGALMPSAITTITWVVAIAVHGMYESPWFDGFLFGMSLVESSFPTDTGGQCPFVWIENLPTFVKYVIKFGEEHGKEQ